jgi:hypothetical protein
MVVPAPGEADPLHPDAVLLSKLGSIVIHTEEVLGSDGQVVDVAALKGLCEDPDVVEWLEQMGNLALLPVKRS